MNANSVNLPQATQAFDAKEFLASVTSEPGVYQMYAQHNKLLYIGKAKNLRNRLKSYFNNRGLSTRIINLVAKINSIDITVTEDETQALILEQNLIKEHQPPYNVMLKDDKSYPYIFLSQHKHPKLGFHRGAKKQQGLYFGPYPSTAAVRQSLNFLQKVFKLRQCEDSYYANRSRPCLQYQINRCLAPCCLAVDQEYQEASEYTQAFLNRQSKDVIDALAKKMETKAQALLFEEAAQLRDQIQQLQYIQSKQGFNADVGDLDILAIESNAQYCCVHCLYIRDGRVLGSRSFYPRIKHEIDLAEALEGFISQHYLHAGDIPDEIIVNRALNKQSIVEQALSGLHQKKIRISASVRGQRLKWLQISEKNAQENLAFYLSRNEAISKRVFELQELLGLTDTPQRMECFDISHHAGQQTTASCVVFSHKGPEKKLYRKFNIEGVTASDDYQAMRQAVLRRYKRQLNENAQLPSIIFIDGGKGQLSAAHAMLVELGITEIPVISIAKGSARKAGMEILHFVDGKQIQLDSRSAALHLIQHIRDESHRFALRGHRQRKKKQQRSPLENIPGIGPKRRRQLLLHFGGLQQIKAASIDELSKVPSINRKTAQLIYTKLRDKH